MVPKTCDVGFPVLLRSAEDLAASQHQAARMHLPLCSLWISKSESATQTSKHGACLSMKRSDILKAEGPFNPSPYTCMRWEYLISRRHAATHDPMELPEHNILYFEMVVHLRTACLHCSIEQRFLHCLRCSLRQQRWAQILPAQA